MNATAKSILVISGKNAVNALLTNTVLAGMLPGLFTGLMSHQAGAWWNVLKVAGACVASREGMIWVPKLIKWSNSTQE